MSEELKAKFMYKGRTFRLYLHPEKQKIKNNIVPVDTISKRIFENRCFYEINILEKTLDYVNESSVVIDCGANIGNHTVFWGSRCKEVYAFEPFKKSFDLLQKNMEVNHIKGSAFNVLLGSKTEKYRVETSKVSRGATHFVPDSNGEFLSMALDSVLDVSICPNFIKIDVEGDELEVLKGAHRILDLHHPILWIEVHFFTIKDLDNQILTHLHKYGYKEDVDVFLTRRRK